MKTELTTTTSTALRIKASQMIKNKPKLAYLVEQKKIKEYSPEEKSVLNKKLISDLMALLNVKESLSNQSRMFLDAMIIEDYKNLTYGEIAEAFKMGVRGELKGIEMYQALDAVIFGKVIKAYRSVKIDLLSDYFRQLRLLTHKLEYEQKEMDKELNIKDVEQTLIKAWNNVREYGNIDGKYNSMNFLYKIITRENLINLTIAEKRQICNDIIELINRRNKNLPRRERKLTHKPDGSIHPAVKVLCENESIKLFLQKFNTEEDLKEFINEYY